MIKTLLKLFFAAAIIYYLVQKGVVDFTMIPASFAYPWSWVIALTLIFSNITLTSLRFKMLLRTKSSAELPIYKIVGLTWIGVFFSAVLPGVVTGDVVKLLYARRLDQKLSKTFLLTTIFMDRVIGLLGLIILLGFFTLMSYQELLNLSPMFSQIISLNLILLSGVMGFLVTLICPSKLQDRIKNSVALLPLIGKKISSIFEQVWHISSHRRIFFFSLLLSLVSQSLNVMAFYTISKHFFDAPFNLFHAFTIIPIGLTLTAIPLTPSGLGVGHAAFAKLFSFFSITTGASLFNLFLIATLFISFLGVIPYLLAGKKSKLSDLSQDVENE